MFHMMEHQRCDRTALIAWLIRTPIFANMARQVAGAASQTQWANDLVDSLIDDGLLTKHESLLHLAHDCMRPAIPS
jgi:transcriptional regulator CtsR